MERLENMKRIENSMERIEKYLTSLDQRMERIEKEFSCIKRSLQSLHNERVD
jgi:chaperonin cofactor prefoldin